MPSGLIFADNDCVVQPLCYDKTPVWKKWRESDNAALHSLFTAGDVKNEDEFCVEGFTHSRREKCIQSFGQKNEMKTSRGFHL